MDNLTSENQYHGEQDIEMTQLSGTGANGRGGDEESQERGSQSNENGRHPLLSDAHPSRMADTSEVASAISNLKNMAKDMVADPMFDPKTISHISESDFNIKKKSLTQNVDFISKTLNIAKDLWEDNDFSQLIKAENEIKITSGGSIWTSSFNPDKSNDKLAPKALIKRNTILTKTTQL